MKKVISIATGATLLFVVAAMPAQAATVEVNGNGAFSVNTVKVSTHSSSGLVQSNKAKFGNTVVVNSKTGGNKANKNTGGEVSVSTGTSTNNVGVVNVANANTNTDPNPCGCACLAPLDIKIVENGVFSINSAFVWTSCGGTTVQSNNATIYNTVVSSSSTGGNSASGNTGAGVSIVSGDSENSVSVLNTANVNTN